MVGNGKRASISHWMPPADDQKRQSCDMVAQDMVGKYHSVVPIGLCAVQLRD